MPTKNTAVTISYFAEDLSAGGGKTGDVANHTIYMIRDGSAVAPTGTKSEVSATYLPGWYKITIEANENTGSLMVLGGKSSTSNVAIRGPQWFNETSVWDETTSGHTTAGTFGAQAATDIDAIVAKLPSKSYLAGSNNSDGDIQLNEATGTLGTGAINSGSFATSSINSTTIAAGAITSSTFAANSITSTVMANGAINSTILAANSITSTVMANDSITSAQLATNAVDEIVDQVWNEVLSGHQTIGSTGYALNVASGSVSTIDAGVSSIVAKLPSKAYLTGTANSDGDIQLNEATGSLATGAIAAASFAANSINSTTMANGAITSSVLAANSITSTVMAANAINSTIVAAGTITSSQFAAGAITSSVLAANSITSTVMANDSITSAQLATTAVDEIVDQVWNEVLSGHQTIGSTGYALNVASGSIDSAATQVSAIYAKLPSKSYLAGSNNTDGDIQLDEATGSLATGAIAAASFAASAINATTLATGTITSAKFAANAINSTTLANNAINSSILAANAITSTQLATTALDAIADSVWNEALGGHVTAGTTGDALNVSSGTILNSSSNVAAIYAKLPSKAYLTGTTNSDGDVQLNEATGSLATGAIAAASFAANSINSATLANGAITSSVLAANSITSTVMAANAINSTIVAAGTITSSQIATGAITSTAFAANSITSTVMANDSITSAQLATNAVDEIVDQVWNEVLSGHQTIGSTGYALNYASGTSDSYGSQITAIYNKLPSKAYLTGTANSDGDIQLNEATGSFAAGTIAAASFAANAINSTTLATGAITSAQFAANSITSTVMANNSITSAQLATGAINSTTLAANSITSTVMANDSITSAQLATTAIDEIVDQVWNEVLSGHQTIGSTGYALNYASGVADSSTAKVDAIYAKLPSKSYLAGSNNSDGDIQLNEATGSFATGTIVAASFAANSINSATMANGAITSSVLAANSITSTVMANDSITSAQLATNAVDEIVDQVWNEVLSGHQTIGSTGYALNYASGVSNSSISTQVTAIYNKLPSKSYLTGSNNSDGDVQLNEATGTLATGAINSGSFATSSINSTTLAAGAITASVFAASAINSSTLAAGAITSSTLAANSITSTVMANDSITSAQLATNAVDEIVDQVWNEVLSGHQTIGSTGYALNYASGISDTGSTKIDAIYAKLPSKAYLTGTANSDGDIQFNEATGSFPAGTIAAASFAANSINSTTLAANAINSTILAAGSITSTTLAANSITSTVLANNAITSAQLATGAITSATFAANSITSTVMANDSITSAQLATTAVNEIVDQVWDEVLSGHQTIGSTGYALNTSSGNLITGVIDANIVSVNGTEIVLDGVVDANITQVSGIAVSIDNFYGASTVADAVWDESISDHQTIGTTGYALNNASGVNNKVDSIYAKLPSKTYLTGSNNSDGDIQLNEATGSLATGAIAAASFAANSINSTTLANNAITSSVLAANSITSTVMANDSITSAQLAATAIDEIVDQVWDEVLSGHQTIGSTGYALSRASGVTDGASSKIDAIYAKLPSKAYLTGTANSDGDIQLNEATGTLATGAINSGSFATSSINSTTIAAGAITAASFAASAINSSTLATGAITASQFAANAITSTVLANNAINSSIVAAGTITSSTFAANAITSTVMANDSITSAQLATSAVDEVVDQVWNEVLSGHVTAGSTGYALTIASGNLIGLADLATSTQISDLESALTAAIEDVPTAAENADAVWNEALGDHLSTGTTGAALSAASGTSFVSSQVTAIYNKLPSKSYLTGTNNSDGDIQLNEATGGLATGAIAAASFAANAINSATIATGALTSSQFAANAITSTVLANNAINASIVAAGTITSSTFAANAITSTAMANDSITSAQLATTAVDEVVDQVWNEVLSDHQTIGSTGYALSRASGIIDSINSSVNTITSKLPSKSYLTGTNNSDGDVQLNEATGGLAAGAIAAAAFAANAINSSTLATGAITATQFAANAITSSILATDSITSSQLATTAVNEIVDQVWDEVLSGHQAIGSTGYALNTASGNLIGVPAGLTAADVWGYSTRMLTSFPSGAFADAVWDEATAGHTTSGTFGEQLKTDVDAILTNTGTALTNTLTAINNNIISTSGVAVEVLVDTTEIVSDLNSLITDIGSNGAGLTAIPWNAAWDAEVQSEATDALNAYDPPTYAELVARTLASADYFDPAADTVANVTNVVNTANITNLPSGAIADAVWDESMLGHNRAGSMGDALNIASGNRMVGVLASPTNITAGTITNLTNMPSGAIAQSVWNTTLANHQVFGTTGRALSAASGNFITSIVKANLVQISGSDATLTNFGYTFDGTGYTNDYAPAQQQQLVNIANVGAAVNTTAMSYTLITGSQNTGTYASTVADDGSYHIIEDTGGTTDFTYNFNVGTDGVPTSITWNGYANSQLDNWLVYASGQATGSWVQIGSLVGIAGITESTESWQLTTDHVDNDGNVRVRFYSTEGTQIATDRLLLSYAIINRSVGYADGAIWIDTNNGVAGTVPFIHGVADKPSNSLSDAYTLASNLGLRRFRIIGNSQLTLDQAYEHYEFMADTLWKLNLGGNIISGSKFAYAQVVGSGAVSDQDHAAIFYECYFGDNTDNVYLPQHIAEKCAIYNPSYAIVISSGITIWHDCMSAVAGNDTPTVVFNDINVDFNCRGYLGGLQFNNMQTGNLASFDCPVGQLKIGATCTGGSIRRAGLNRLRDYSGGAVSVTDGYGMTIDTDSRGLVGLSGVLPVNVAQVSGVPVSLADFGGTASDIAVSGIVQANVIYISGVPVNIDSSSVADSAELTTLGNLLLNRARIIRLIP